MKKQKSPGDRIFISMVYVLMGLMGLICLYPMWHVVMASFSDPIELMRHTGVILKPLGFSLEGYRVVIENPNILPSYFNTIVYVLVGTAINMFLTILGAYALSRKGFMLKRPLTLLIVFTMYFNAGLIPNFLLVKGLGLYNTIWALVLPGAISTWNLIVMKTSFQSIPVSLEESARLDGAGVWKLFRYIELPLMWPVIRLTLILATVNSLKYFDLVYIMSNGGPNHASEVLASYVVKNAFNSMRIGYANTVAVLLLVLGIFFIVLYNKILAPSSASD